MECTPRKIQKNEKGQEEKPEDFGTELQRCSLGNISQDKKSIFGLLDAFLQS